MIRLLVSTTCRRTLPQEKSGFLHVVDIKKKKVLSSCGIIEPSYLACDPNPRGGLRGGKGIAVGADQVLVANQGAIFRFDPQWNLLGTISHPSCAGIHEIKLQEETVWVTSNRNDLLMQFDFSGRMLKCFDLRKPSPALTALKWNPPVLINSESIRQGDVDFRDPRTHKFEKTCGGHVNSLCMMADGDILVSLGIIWGRNFAALFRLKYWLIKMKLWPFLLGANKMLRGMLKLQKPMHSELLIQPARSSSAIVRIKPDSTRSLCLEIPDVTVPSHNLILQADDSLVYLNSSLGEVLHIEPATGKVLSTTRITKGFLRGGANITTTQLVLGSTDELIIFDLDGHKVLDRMAFTSNLKEFAYDIQLLPDNFSLLPKAFPVINPPADMSGPVF